MNTKEAFTYQFQGGVKDCLIGLKVKAFRTATAGLILTPSLDKALVEPTEKPLEAKKWTITHEATGYSVIGQNNLGLKKARYIAGALGGVEVDWTQKDGAKVVNGFYAVVEPKFKAWHQAMRKAKR